jgi:hypothetical protein
LAAATVGALLAAPSAALAARSWTHVNDEYAIWALKGRFLSLAGDLRPELFANVAGYGYAHLDYPLLIPALVVWTDGWSGGPHDGPAHLQGALIGVAFVALAAEVTARRAGLVAGIVAAAAAVVVGGFASDLPRLYADGPAAAFAAAALVLLVGWLEEGGRPWLVAAAVCAAGAAMTKNEGLAFALAVGAAGVAAAPRRDRLRAAVVPAAALVAALPWALWSRLHGVQNDVVNGATLRQAPHNLGRLATIGREMWRAWPGPPLLALAAVVVALLLAFTGRRRRAALAVAISGALALAALVATYLVTPLDLVEHLRSSVDRVLLFPALVAWLAIPLLNDPGWTTRRSAGTRWSRRQDEAG